MKAILIVEDEFDIAEALEAVLVSEGYKTRVANDGAAGLAAMQAERPDLVITDIMMPRMTGLELIMAMRADAVFAKIPVLVMTAAQPPSEVLKWQIPVFRKPFDIDDFLRKMESFLTGNALTGSE